MFYNTPIELHQHKLCCITEKLAQLRFSIRVLLIFFVNLLTAYKQHCDKIKPEVIRPLCGATERK